MYGLLAKLKVKTAEYWPRTLAKNEQGQYPGNLTKQDWSIKALSHGFQENVSCGTRRVVHLG